MHMPSLLLIDDNIEFTNILDRFFTAKGFCVHCAENGAVGLGKYSEGKERNECYAAVLLDIQMPVMNGYEVVEHIRDRERESGLRTPIIGMSGENAEVDNYDFDNFLCKPFQFEAALAAILAAIKPV